MIRTYAIILSDRSQGAGALPAVEGLFVRRRGVFTNDYRQLAACAAADEAV